MKLIVGLGNPGAQYDKTRHNVGFMVAGALAGRHASGQVPKSRFQSVTLDAHVGSEKVLLMKPTTYMNRSGQAVGEAVRFYKLDPQEDLVVIVDDIALPVGHIRVRKRGGSGGHNGLSDIDRVLGGEDYMRVRVGVGNVPKLMNQADWVLSRFMDEERDDVERSITRAAYAGERIVGEGITKAMNEFNTKLVKSPAKDGDGDQPGAGKESGGGPEPVSDSQNINNTNQSARDG
ncbi:MAG: aminoacyl-tRNA hydrolase [Phycisphaerales bacterium]